MENTICTLDDKTHMALDDNKHMRSAKAHVLPITQAHEHLHFEHIPDQKLSKNTASAKGASLRDAWGQKRIKHRKTPPLMTKLRGELAHLPEIEMEGTVHPRTICRGDFQGYAHIEPPRGRGHKTL